MTLSIKINKNYRMNYLKPVTYLTIATFASLSLFSYFRNEETCRKLVDLNIRDGVSAIEKNVGHIKNVCTDSVNKTGDYRELYAYYKLYKYVGELNNVKDQRHRYHWLLYFANQNSEGKYQKELKDLENEMTQGEKAEAFLHISFYLSTEENLNLIKKHDFEKSSEYLKRAAELGNWFAQAELGACYYDGKDRVYQIEFRKDYVEAYKWVFISMQHSEQRKYDYDIASKRLGMIKSKMSGDQIKEAKEASDKWLTENTDFVKSHPLKITPMTKEEIDIEKRKTKEMMEKYKPGSRYATE